MKSAVLFLLPCSCWPGAAFRLRRLKAGPKAKVPASRAVP